MKNILVGAALAASALVANAAGSILAANPGPLGSFNFSTVVFNGTSGDITKITFDLSGSAGGLVFGGLNSGSPIITGLGPGATATLFGSEGDSVFGFTFTGFNSFETLRFSWDPDIAGNSSYGAKVSEFVGTKITADVDFGSGPLVSYSDTVTAVGPDVAANLAPAPVPEPSSYALMLAGLVGVSFLARRRGTEK